MIQFHFCFFRCILNKKAKSVHKIIIDLFNIVVTFSLLLKSQPWIFEGGEIRHPAFAQAVEQYRKFQEYSKFLYTGKFEFGSCFSNGRTNAPFRTIIH